MRDNISTTRGEGWRVENGLIVKGSRVFVPSSSQHLESILQLAHTNGHEGIQKPCTVSEGISSLTMTKSWSKTMSTHVLCVKAIRLKHYTPLACYNQLKYQHKSGQTFP